MSTQKIFLITPLGNRQSLERCHADKMWNSVFKPLSSRNVMDNIKFEFIRSDLLPESGDSRIKEIMSLIRECRGCIVDLYKINNLNVIYEVGLAHSQGKRVFFLRSDKINNISKKVSDVVKAMISGDTNTNLYRPYFYQPTEQYVSTVLEEINGKINNLERLLKDFGTSSEDERTLAQYIIGENEAFRALTEAVQKSSISAKTTRFSPYSVVGRQNTFFNAIKQNVNLPLYLYTTYGSCILHTPSSNSSIQLPNNTRNHHLYIIVVLDLFRCTL